MPWLIPVTMGLWAVWTWTADRERARLDERAKLAALYVNPFLSACEDLQSRIYHVVELGGFRTLRKRYPDGAYAEEILYLIARYFGWAAVLSRHSPYAQDPFVMGLSRKVRDAFASTGPGFAVGPFNFFHPEQKALGKIVMSRTAGPHGMELDTISSYEFKARLASPPSVRQPICAADARGAAQRGRGGGVARPETAGEGSALPRGAAGLHRRPGGI